MSQAPITPDDPRLTAYVLGELSPEEAAKVEQALARSPELRRAADELRETSAGLFAALQQEPIPAAGLHLPRPERSPAVSTPVAAPVAAIGHPSARRSRREGLLLINALTLLILLGVVVAFQSDGPPQGVSAPLALQDESRFDKLAAFGLLRLAERPADVRDRWQETVDRYNLLMEQDRFTEAQAIARESLEAAPRDPVAQQMYRQSHFAARSRGPHPDRRRFSESLQDVEAGVQHPSPVAESAPAGGGSPVPVEQRIERSHLSISGPQLPAPTELEKLRRVPETPGLGRSEERQGAPLILTAEPRPTTENELKQRLLSRPGAAPDSTTPGEASGRTADAGGALPWSGETAGGQRGTSPVPILNKSPYVAGNAVLERRNLADGTANDGAVRFGRSLTESRYSNSWMQAPAQHPYDTFNSPTPVDSHYAEHRFHLIEKWSWRDQDQDTVLPFPAYAPSGTESYAPIVENDFILPRGEAALSTFALDVDTASYSNVRRFLTNQQLPPPDAVRLEELVNYFRYDLPQPEGEEPFSVTLEAASCPWNPVHRLVRIGLQGREIDLTQRPLTRLVFLLDVSGSMAPANRLPLVKESMKLLVEQLGENDRIAIVTYAGEAELKLDSTPGDQQETILAAIDGLRAGGSTNGAGGIQLAYQIAARQFEKEASNRIILCTDGDFNVGVSSDDELVRMIEEKRKTGVFLSIFGFGYGNLKDAKLEGLANKGNGHYAYIDDLDEARKVFIEELTGMLYTIAKDVKLQVEFNPANVAAYRLLGYENRLLQAEDFNNDKVDAGEMGAGHSVTALYEIVPADGANPVEATTAAEPAVDALRYQTPESVQRPESRVQSAPLAARPLATGHSALNELLTLKLRYKQPDGDVSVQREFPLANEPRASSQDLQFAAAVAGFGLLLRNSQYAAGCNWDLVIELAEGGKGDDPTGRRGEFIDLARQARRLWQASNRGLPPSGRIPQMTSATPGSIPAAVAAQTAILQIDQTTQYVQINRGALDDVRPGMTFYVLQQPPAGAGGQQPPGKGKLEVVSVSERTATGRILAQDGTQTIAVGDPVVSPEWPPKVVAVSGSRFAVVSLGAKHGNRDGELFEVVRFDSQADAAGQRRPRFLGELRIIDVQHDVSVGQFAPATADDGIAVGDRVTPRR